MSSFELHPRIEADTLAVAELGLSSLRLMKDSNYTWLMLLPRKAGAVELIDLTKEEQHQLMDEIALVSTLVRQIGKCEKLNVGALGNIVTQLHIHVIGRYNGDPAWPGPVWGAGPAKPYSEGEAEAVIANLQQQVADMTR